MHSCVRVMYSLRLKHLIFCLLFISNQIRKKGKTKDVWRSSILLNDHCTSICTDFLAHGISITLVGGGVCMCLLIDHTHAASSQWICGFYTYMIFALLAPVEICIGILDLYELYLKYFYILMYTIYVNVSGLRRIATHWIT